MNAKSFFFVVVFYSDAVSIIFSFEVFSVLSLLSKFN